MSSWCLSILFDIDMDNVGIVKLPGEGDEVLSSGRWSEVELAIVLILEIFDRDGRTDVLKPKMVYLSLDHFTMLLAERLVLISVIGEILFVFFWDFHYVETTLV